MSMICLEVSLRPVNGKTITSFYFVIVFSHLPSVKRTHTKKQSTNEMSAVSVVGISAERKSSLWLSWLNNSHEQDAKDLSVVYVIRRDSLLCPRPLCLDNAITPRARSIPLGNHWLSCDRRTPVKTRCCWSPDQASVSHVVHCVATTDGASFTPHQFLR